MPIMFFCENMHLFFFDVEDYSFLVFSSSTSHYTMTAAMESNYSGGNKLTKMKATCTF